MAPSSSGSRKLISRRRRRSTSIRSLFLLLRSVILSSRLKTVVLPLIALTAFFFLREPAQTHRPSSSSRLQHKNHTTTISGSSNNNNDEMMKENNNYYNNKMKAKATTTAAAGDDEEILLVPKNETSTATTTNEDVAVTADVERTTTINTKLTTTSTTAEARSANTVAAAADRTTKTTTTLTNTAVVTKSKVKGHADTNAVLALLRAPEPVVSTLLQPPLDYQRRGIPLSEVYKFLRPSANKHAINLIQRKNRFLNQECSCLNGKSYDYCCHRIFRRAHKMGVVMTRSVFKKYVPRIYMFSRDPFELNYLVQKPNSDYRDVLMLRNIYESFASGYLYHKEGKECWVDGRGRSVKDPEERWKSVAEWYKVIQYEPDPPRSNRSICQYLKDESIEAGLRAYIEYIMHSQYIVMFNHFALSRASSINIDDGKDEFLQEVGERTLIICYEDVVNPDKANDAMNRALAFWYNTTVESGSFKPYNRGPPNGIGGLRSRGGGGGSHIEREHGTSHDPDLRQKLRNAIDEIDRKYYNGDIAWLDSIFPC